MKFKKYWAKKRPWISPRPVIFIWCRKSNIRIMAVWILFPFKFIAMIFQESQKDYYIQTIRRNKDRLQLKDQYYTLFRHLVICCCLNGGSPKLRTNTRALAKEFKVTNKTIYNRLIVLVNKRLIIEKLRLTNGLILPC